MRAGVLERGDRGHRAAARGEHRIDDERRARREIARQLRVVLRGHRRVFVALQADVADAGVRKQLEHRFHHAEAGAQHRHDDDVGVEAPVRRPVRAASRRASATSGRSRVASMASRRLSRCASRRKWPVRVVRSRSANSASCAMGCWTRWTGTVELYTEYQKRKWGTSEPPTREAIRFQPMRSAPFVGIALGFTAVTALLVLSTRGQSGTPVGLLVYGRHRRHDGRRTAG